MSLLDLNTTVADSLQLNMLHAKPAAAPTPNSTRAKTVSTSLPATPAVLVGRSPPSRPVSVDRLVAERDKAKRGYGWVGDLYGAGCGKILFIYFFLFISPIFV